MALFAAGAPCFPSLGIFSSFSTSLSSSDSLSDFSSDSLTDSIDFDFFAASFWCTVVLVVEFQVRGYKSGKCLANSDKIQKNIDNFEM